MNQEFKHRLIARSLLERPAIDLSTLVEISIIQTLKEFPIEGEYNFNKVYTQKNRFLKIYKNLLKMKSKKEIELLCMTYSKRIKYKIALYNKEASKIRKISKKELISYLITEAETPIKYYLEEKWKGRN